MVWTILLHKLKYIDVYTQYVRIHEMYSFVSGALPTWK